MSPVYVTVHCSRFTNKNKRKFLFIIDCRNSQPIRAKKVWVEKIRRKDWLPSSNSCLCSDHFSESCFDRAGKIIKLKKDAIPTRFKSFPKHMQKVTHPSPCPSIRINFYRQFF